MTILGRFKELWHSWNAFTQDQIDQRRVTFAEGASFGYRPDRVRLRWSHERSILASIYTRISVDVAGFYFRHVRLDEEDRYLEDINSGFNRCLKFKPNKDQGPRHFRQDIVTTLLEEGVCAIVPVDTTINPSVSGAFDIKSMRVGRVTAWYPDQVRVMLYNDRKGLREEIVVDKKFVAIVENPLSLVMNEPNSTLQRLIRKLNLLDVIDDNSSSGKLDIIIQLPYTLRSEAKREAAKQRRADLDEQMNGSKYGIGYIDGTEKVVQLNRPAENNMLEQIKDLRAQVYSELGVTPEVMAGTADEATMLNYQNRTIRPIVDAVVEAMRIAFLTETALSQQQSVLAFRNPLELVPAAELADIADKFSRNTIAAPNDFRTVIGWKPSKDPEADKLKNRNMPDPNQAPSGPMPKQSAEEEENSQNGSA